MVDKFVWDGSLAQALRCASLLEKGKISFKIVYYPHRTDFVLYQPDAMTITLRVGDEIEIFAPSAFFVCRNCYRK